jgi:hypothetical protein
MAPDPHPELPAGLVERLLGEPALRADRVEAGRQRLAGGPVDGDLVAAVLLAEAVCAAA